MCGIFGVFNARKAAELAYLGLHAQQHRADEYAGIVTSDSSLPYRAVGRGPVSSVFSQTDLNELHGRMALGHIRYSTVEDIPNRDNAQPIIAAYDKNFLAIAHNGNITNVAELCELLAPGTVLRTAIDTEVLLRRLCTSKGSNIVERLRNALLGVRGAYSLALLLPDTLVAVRDPSGMRPLALGRKNNSYFIASETSAFAAVEADYIRDVAPGEILVINEKRGLFSFEIPRPRTSAVRQCVFELIYFGSPASHMFGKSVSLFRERLGEKLEELYPVPDADIVCPVPDSANSIALGYASSGRSGRLTYGLLRNHYTGRTFIAPSPDLRFTKASRKFKVDTPRVKGKRVVLVDDSIVRLNTLPVITRLLHNAGATAIHVRIACPPIISPCHYGIDTPTREELSANRMTKEEMCRHIEATSLEFLPFSALRSLVGSPASFCFACMNGAYPPFMEPLAKS